MTTVMLAPVGEHARFLADLSRQGVALTCLWTGPGDDPKVAAKLDALRRLGVAEQPCHRSDLGNVMLLGAIPPGWSPSDFAGHVV